MLKIVLLCHFFFHIYIKNGDLVLFAELEFKFVPNEVESENMAHMYVGRRIIRKYTADSVQLVLKILKETQPLPFLHLLLSKETFPAVVAVLFPSID